MHHIECMGLELAGYISMKKLVATRGKMHFEVWIDYLSFLHHTVCLYKREHRVSHTCVQNS
jgi:hypothetical protein